MNRKIGFGLLWAGFLTYAFLLAPPNQPNTPGLLKNLSTGQLEGINPLITALFYILGIVPLAYGCLMLIDGRGQKIKAWPFVATSFGVGAFALLPYLALREPNPSFPGKKDIFLKILDSRWMGVFLTLGASILVAYGLIAGNWADFVQQWQTSRFVHVMSLDFCLLCLLFPALLGDDMARRGINNPKLFWAVSLVPLFGILIYLCLRPPLQDVKADVSSPHPQPATK